MSWENSKMSWELKNVLKNKLRKLKNELRELKNVLKNKLRKLKNKLRELKNVLKNMLRIPK